MNAMDVCWTSSPANSWYYHLNDHLIVQQLDLHRLCRRRGRSLECPLALLQREAVRHERFQINQTLRDQCDGFRIRLPVPELELNVDLAE